MLRLGLRLQRQKNTILNQIVKDKLFGSVF
jgi:hypothetical protein